MGSGVWVKDLQRCIMVHRRWGYRGQEARDRPGDQGTGGAGRMLALFRS